MISSAAISILIIIINAMNATAKDLPVDLCFGSAPTTAEFTCMRQAYDEIAIFAYSGMDGIEEYSLQTFINAKNAGLKVQIAMSPCSSVPYEEIIQDFIKKFKNKDIEKVWIFPYSFFEGCEWFSYAPSVNCQYFSNLLQGLRKEGFKLGVYTSRFIWKKVFGSETACPEVSDFPLAWQPIQQQQNGKPDFELYKQIGGWSKPFMKNYDQKQICGRNLLSFYYE